MLSILKQPDNIVAQSMKRFSIDYDLFNLNDYVKIRNDSIYLGYLVSQRGCPYPCNFCSESYLIGNVRENSSDYIIEKVIKDFIRECDIIFNTDEQIYKR